jgi:multisubunit Na+/H+ antiporter MnhC subunit
VTPGQLIALLVFIAIVIGVAVLGVRLGMLLAPRIGRLADRGDEEDRGDD